MTPRATAVAPGDAGGALRLAGCSADAFGDLASDDFAGEEPDTKIRVDEPETKLKAIAVNVTSG